MARRDVSSDRLVLVNGHLQFHCARRFHRSNLKQSALHDSEDENILSSHSYRWAAATDRSHLGRHGPRPTKQAFLFKPPDHCVHWSRALSARTNHPAAHSAVAWVMDNLPAHQVDGGPRA